jgi:hypothetical protein
MTRSKLLRERTHSRMVVTMLSGDTYDGLHVGFDGHVLKLYESALVGTAGAAVVRTPVDGVLFLPWGQVAYVQCP